MAWAPDYASTAELRAYRQIEDTDDDTELALAVTAASRGIDRFANRQFGVVASVEARRYRAHLDRQHGAWVIPIDDLMTTTGLVIELDPDADLTFSDSLTTSEVDFWPINAAETGRPWTQLVVLPDAAATPDGREGSTRVTGLWGWTAVPDAIKQACLLQASRLTSRRLSQFGVGGAIEMGEEFMPAAKLDPDVRVLVSKFRRYWGAR